MKLLRLIPGLALGWCFAALAQTQIPYGVAVTVPFCLYDYTTPNEKEVTIAFEAADVKVSQAGTEANSTNAPTDRGECFDVVLTATETDTTYVKLMIDDDDNVWLPIDFTFFTYGHPDSAQPWIGIPGPAFGTAQAADGNTSDIQLPSTYAYGDDALVGATLYIVAGAGAGDTRNITDGVGATDEQTVNAAFSADPTTTTKFYVFPANNANLLVSNGIVQANVKQLDDDATAAANAELVFDNTGFAMSNSTVGTVTTLTGHTAQTGDAFARLGAPAGASVSADIVVLDNFVDDLETRVGAPSNLGSGATLAANAIDIEGFADNLPADPADASDIAALFALVESGITWSASWDAEVQSEVDDALRALSLNMLLAETYNPASEPASDSLLGDLTESDVGVTRFTTNALEQAPASGSGGDTADAIANAVWDEVVETGGGTVTARCATAITLAMAAGTFSQSGSVMTFRDPSGTTNRIVATLTPIAAPTARSGVTVTCP